MIQEKSLMKRASESSRRALYWFLALLSNIIMGTSEVLEALGLWIWKEKASSLFQAIALILLGFNSGPKSWELLKGSPPEITLHARFLRRAIFKLLAKSFEKRLRDLR